jgi:hypothetical protein
LPKVARMNKNEIFSVFLKKKCWACSVFCFFHFWPFSVKLGICFSHPKFTFSFWVEFQTFVVSVGATVGSTMHLIAESWHIYCLLFTQLYVPSLRDAKLPLSHAPKWQGVNGPCRSLHMFSPVFLYCKWPYKSPDLQRASTQEIQGGTQHVKVTAQCLQYICAQLMPLRWDLQRYLCGGGERLYHWVATGLAEEMVIENMYINIF